MQFQLRFFGFQLSFFGILGFLSLFPFPTGWIGFGLSPGGGMEDADIVVAWIKDGETFFYVR